MKGTPEERQAALHGWLEGLTANPPKGIEQAEQFLELAGDLFDEHYLDGQQYHYVYQVGQVLKGRDEGDLAELARLCVKLI